MYGIGILKGIVGSHVSGEHGSLYGLYGAVRKISLDLLAVGKAKIRHGHMDPSVLCHGNRFRQVGNHIILLQSCLHSFHAGFHQLAVLMVLIHIKCMPGGSLHHLLALGKDHCLKYVHHLGDICHLHPVTVLVEQVQIDACHQCVPHGILLIQEAGIGAGLHIIPGAPLIHDHADLLFRIILIHNGAMSLDQLIHLQGRLQSAVPVLLIKVQSQSLLIPISGRYGIIMKRHAIHKSPAMVKGGLQHLVGPVIVIHIGSAGNLKDRILGVVIAHIGLVSAIQVSIIFRTHVAAAAPVLISYSEIINLPGLLVSVGLAQLCHGRNALKGHIFHPFAHFLNGTAAHVSVDISLAAQLLTQLHKLVGSKAVILHHTAPVGVNHFLTALLGTDTLLPVILVGKTASGPAKHGHVDLLQRLHHIRAHTLHIGNMGIFSHKNAFIDASSQMLREMSLQFRINVPLLHIWIHI